MKSSTKLLTSNIGETCSIDFNDDVDVTGDVDVTDDVDITDDVAVTDDVDVIDDVVDVNAINVADKTLAQNTQGAKPSSTYGGSLPKNLHALFSDPITSLQYSG